MDNLEGNEQRGLQGTKLWNLFELSLSLSIFWEFLFLFRLSDILKSMFLIEMKKCMEQFFKNAKLWVQIDLKSYDWMYLKSYFLDSE